MTDRVMPVTAILAAGIGLGVAGDRLLWESTGPGLNVVSSPVAQPPTGEIAIV